MDATRIEEVVEEFVSLKRRGSSLIGLCPFHNEKSPSFNVTPTRNMFKCFGCGKGGDAITFLKEHENFSYADSLRWLAKKYNIVIEEIQLTAEQLAEQQINDSLYIVNEFAQQTYADELFKTDLGRNVGLAYFKQRGFTEETIQKWGLGYAPDGRDFLIRQSKDKGYNSELLKKTGLTSRDGQFDFFRGRVIFPIHAMSGKVAAFAGRIMGKIDNAPKYINSPETEIYNKSRTLYGMHFAKKAVRQLDECILTEGYTDVMSLHQAGVENVVASSGTSLTVEQILLIKRNTQNIRILYDGDAAGVKAALRGLDLVLEQDMNVRIVLLPDGDDPDSFVQKVGAEQFRAFIDREAVDFILFKTRLLIEETIGDPIRKSNLVKEIVSTIAKIPDPIKRSLYQKECSALLQIDEQILVAETKKIIGSSIKKAEEKAARAPQAVSDNAAPFPEFPSEEPPGYAVGGGGSPDYFEPNRTQPPPRPVEKSMLGDDFQEKEIVRILIQFGGQMLESQGITVGQFVLSDIEESLGSFENPVYGKLLQECQQLLAEGKPLHQHHFLTHENREFSQLAINLLAQPFDYSPNWEAMYHMPLQNQAMPELNFNEDTRQALDRFKLRKVIKMCEMNQQRIRQAEQSGDYDTSMRFMKIQQKLVMTRGELAKRTGTVVFK